MLSRADLVNRVHGLAIFRHIDALEEGLPLARLLAVHDKLLITHGQAAFEPACGVQHEIDSGHTGGAHGIGRFIGGLGIGDF